MLSTPLHMLPLHEQKMWLAAKNRMTAEVLKTKVRVDDHALKLRKLDALPELLRQMAEAKRKNPQLVYRSLPQ